MLTWRGRQRNGRKYSGCTEDVKAGKEAGSCDQPARRGMADEAVGPSVLSAWKRRTERGSEGTGSRTGLHGPRGTGTGGGSHRETKAGGAPRTKEPSAGLFPGEEGQGPGPYSGHLGKIPSPGWRVNRREEAARRSKPSSGNSWGPAVTGVSQQAVL